MDSSSTPLRVALPIEFLYRIYGGYLQRSLFSGKFILFTAIGSESNRKKILDFYRFGSVSGGSECGPVDSYWICPERKYGIVRTSRSRL